MGSAKRAHHALAAGKGLLSVLANRLYGLRRRLIGSAAPWASDLLSHRRFPTGRLRLGSNSWSALGCRSAHSGSAIRCVVDRAGWAGGGDTCWSFQVLRITS
jgi:hypothetical protein